MLLPGTVEDDTKERGELSVKRGELMTRLLKRAVPMLAICGAFAFLLAPSKAAGQHSIPSGLQQLSRIDVSEQFARMEAYNRHIAAANAAHVKVRSAQRSNSLYGLGALLGIAGIVYGAQTSPYEADNTALAVMLAGGGLFTFSGIHIMLGYMDIHTWRKTEQDEIRRARAVFPDRDPIRGRR